jgi:hypothetical protein
VSPEGGETTEARTSWLVQERSEAGKGVCVQLTMTCGLIAST